MEKEVGMRNSVHLLRSTPQDRAPLIDVAQGGRELPVAVTPRRVVDVYSTCWTCWQRTAVALLK